MACALPRPRCGAIERWRSFEGNPAISASSPRSHVSLASINEPAPAPARFRFSTRALFLLTLVCAVATASCVGLYNSARQNWGYGPYASFERWPRALISLIGDDTSLRDHVQPYGLGDFINHRSIWKIDAGSSLRDRLLEKHELIATDSNHPKAAQPMASIPPAWLEHPWDRCAWYSTPGYGEVHIEGIDLFLIAEDTETGAMVALHEWLF